MANTFNDYTATSAQLDSSDAAYGFVFNFPFLDASHIVVEVDGSVLASSNYSIQTSPDKRVLVASGITAGQVVRVKRDSNADSDAPLVDFVNGSVLNETELDKSYLHNLYLNEEIAAMNDLSLQKKVGDTTKWDAKSQELVNVTDPTLVQSASTKNYVDTQISNTITGSSTVSSKYTFTGDNTTTAFTFSPAINLDGDTMYEVAIDGVLQAPTTAYAIDANANTITFTSAPPTSAAIVVVQRGYAVPVTSNVTTDKIDDNAITSAKIQDNAITTAKIATNAVTNSEIQDGSITSGKVSTSDSIFNIQTTGNVGVGTTSPSAKLVVETDSSTYSLDTDDFSQVGLLIKSNTAEGIGNKGGSIAFTALTGAGGKHAAITAVQTDVDSNNVGLAFEVHPGGTSGDPLVEAMRIDRNGKVGIGTTSPSTSLDINKGLTESEPVITLSRGGTPKGRVAIAKATDSILDSSGAGDLCIRSENHNILFGTAEATRTDMTIKSDGTINFSNVSTYANDTAAGTGGLVAGDVYKTSAGELRIKL